MQTELNLHDNVLTRTEPQRNRTMLIITMAANGEPLEQVFGCVGCEQIAPVNDYQLVELGGNNDTRITTLSAYSRWTEPAYALLARLVRHHPRDPEVAAPETHLRSTIYLGQSLANRRPVERLEARIIDGYLHAFHEDDLGTRSVKQGVRPGYAHPVDMLEHAVRLALWRADSEPPIPPPLTEVPIHGDGGQQYVLVRDIPEFPRRFFEQRRRGCTVPMPGAYYAGDWWQFIGGRP